MNIETLKQILNNRVASLQMLMQTHYSSGNLEEYVKIEAELLETQATLQQLG